MIVRIVKLTFRPDAVDTFKQILEDSKHLIRNFPGNENLEMLQMLHEPNIFFTYSYWKSEEDLENYRRSELFKQTWTKTKVLFLEKAEAWTVNRLHKL